MLERYINRQVVTVHDVSDPTYTEVAFHCRLIQHKQNPYSNIEANTSGVRTEEGGVGRTEEAVH